MTTDMEQRLRALEQELAEIKQELADERRERIAADRCIQRMQQDREWRREVA